MFHQLKNGCNWQDLPPYSTVFWHYKRWRSESLFTEIVTALHAQARQQVKEIELTLRLATLP